MSDFGDRKIAPVEAARAGPSRPPWFFIALLTYAPLMLVVDGRLPAPWPWQYVLGAATFAVLWLATTRLDRADRAQVWLCVAVATGFEYLGSQVWGGYRYRFGGIPLFVPPGHGLIYVFAIGFAATNWARRHERWFTAGVFAVAAAWVVAGVALLPPLTNRFDVHGAMWLPLFAYVTLFSPRRVIFAAIFIATTDIELAGTWTQSWTWMTTIPWYNVGSGNPPSAIAGGYAIIDGTVLLLGGWLLRFARIPLRTTIAPNSTNNAIPMKRSAPPIPRAANAIAESARRFAPSTSAAEPAVRNATTARRP